ncbi:ISL3 family transposase [Tichowtungia aerotolerans]|uniref:ISL3 family transposase n=1 Tax=Tichowtungia aerotolerans TaxID=2697043 RepID=A0A6P1M5A2_9BACT|nr:ISL3 family transposase [Tichowtungia aerotolerans]QHI69027.1 ISL3 family transposase [Tichowtungia aerotolerans]
MTAQKILKILGEWEGFRVGTVGPAPGDPSEVWIELTAENGSGRCSGCGSLSHTVHDSTIRWIRELPVFGKTTWLMITRRRMLCPACGPKLEALTWLDPYSRFTRRFEESVARLCKVATHKHVAAEYGINRKTVKNIEKRYLQRELGPINLAGVELLAMDEFAIQKGHRYATVIVDPTCKRVLWIGRGRTRAAIHPFFKLLGEDGCKQIKAVAMDMNSSYEQEVWEHCPDADIVYDLFHVVAKYGREVIDRVRVDEANRLRDDKRARRVVKGSRWLLLRNRDNITKPSDQVRLDELLEANRNLATVYVMKADLKELWSFRDTRQAQSFGDQWYERAVQSSIEPLIKFANRLAGYIKGIISHARWPLHTSLLEGINNKIKVLKRMAYGYRDDEFFFLKIRQAFPGNGA